MKNSIVCEKQRNVSLELLRIISMIMIIILHLNFFGGLIEEVGTKVFTGKYIMVWASESLSMVAVNIYVFISGYFLIKSKFKLSKIILLWIQVFFYSITIYIILVAIKQEVFSVKHFIKSIMPINFNQYWFITIYLILYAISPLINIVINSLDKSKHCMYIILFMLIFCFLYVKNALNLASGGGLLWFIYLYFVAAYIRLYYKPNKKYNKYLLIYIVFSIFTLVIKCIVDYLANSRGIMISQESYLSYNSPAIFISSISLFLAALNFNISNRIVRRVIVCLSPFTLGVYLIHMHPQLAFVLWSKILFVCQYMQYNSYIYIIVVLGVYFICTYIDFLRKKVFDKMKISILADRIAKYICCKVINIFKF